MRTRFFGFVPIAIVAISVTGCFLFPNSQEWYSYVQSVGEVTLSVNPAPEDTYSDSFEYTVFAYHGRGLTVSELRGTPGGGGAPGGAETVGSGTVSGHAGDEFVTTMGRDGAILVSVLSRLHRLDASWYAVRQLDGSGHYEVGPWISFETMDFGQANDDVYVEELALGKTYELWADIEKVVAGEGSLFYVTTANRDIVAVDAASGDISMLNVTTPDHTLSIVACDPALGFLYSASQYGGSEVYRFDLVTNEFLTPLPVPYGSTSCIVPFGDGSRILLARGTSSCIVDSGDGSTVATGAIEGSFPIEIPGQDAFVSVGWSGAWRYEVAGSSITVSTSQSYFSDNIDGEQPDLSDDASRLVAMSGTRLIQIDTDTLTEISASGYLDSDPRCPVYIADDRFIAVTSGSSYYDSHSNMIFILDSDTYEVVRELWFPYSNGNTDSTLTVTADGEYLIGCFDAGWEESEPSLINIWRVAELTGAAE